jgi:hypothetical protein
LRVTICAVAICEKLSFAGLDDWLGPAQREIDAVLATAAVRRQAREPRWRPRPDLSWLSDPNLNPQRQL